jgi:hypothetical protein
MYALKLNSCSNICSRVTWQQYLLQFEENGKSWTFEHKSEDEPKKPDQLSPCSD